MPGIESKDIDLSVTNDVLTIKGERKQEKEEKFNRKEFSYMSFQRTFTIPENLVSGDKIQAKYENGILHITLPKKEEVKPKPAREIKIN